MRQSGGVINLPVSKERIRAHRRRLAKDYTQNILIVCLPIVGFLLFGLVPMAMSLIMSFADMRTTMISDATWVGFDNFVQIFTGKLPALKYTYLNTLIYMVSLPLGIIIDIVVATFVSRLAHGKGIVRGILFIPYVCSSVALAVIFQLMYRESGGVLNNMLGAMGFKGVRWLTSSPVLFMFSTVLLGVWAGSGYNIVLISAALANVDKSYYEAAEIDGASSVTVFFRITLPAITPTLSFIVTLGLIGTMQVFTEPRILVSDLGDIKPYWKDAAGENIVSGHMTVVNYIYYLGFENAYQYGYGMASACAWVLAVIIFVVTRINQMLQKKWVSYDF